MKIRNGFVSNSSSSSFILGVPSSSKNNSKIKIEVDLSDLVEREINTKEEAKEYFLDSYCLDYYLSKGMSFEESLEKDSIKDLYDDIINCLDRGKTVVVIYASSDGGGIGEFIYDNGLPKLSKEYEVILDEN